MNNIYAKSRTGVLTSHQASQQTNVVWSTRALHPQATPPSLQDTAPKKGDGRAHCVSSPLFAFDLCIRETDSFGFWYIRWKFSSIKEISQSFWADRAHAATYRPKQESLQRGLRVLTRFEHFSQRTLIYHYIITEATWLICVCGWSSASLVGADWQSWSPLTSSLTHSERILSRRRWFKLDSRG